MYVSFHNNTVMCSPT